MSLPNPVGQKQHEQQRNDCSHCHSPPDENMTTCVDCHKIFHKICVNVTDDDITFKCLQCSAIRPNSPAPSVTSKCSNRSRLSQSRKIELQLKKLEEERTLNKEYLDKKYQLLEEAEDLTDISSNNTQSVHDWLASSESHPNINKPGVEDINNPTQVQTTHLSDQHFNSNVRSHMRNQSTIICSDSNILSNNNVRFVPQTVTTAAMNSSLTMASVPNCTTTIPTYSGYQQRMQLPGPCPTNYPQGTILTSLPTNINSQNLFNSVQQEFIPRQPISSTTNFVHNAPTNSAPCQPSNFATPLTMLPNHINSRQSLPKELPVFSGQPEEWPIFQSTYEWSTAACAFTDSENLIRLQKALQGEALRSVQQMLIHPSNVPSVMQVLRMLYGQPEKIINSIKNRINLTPKVDENNLKTLTSLAIEVRSLISTITASNLCDEINNSSLLLDLIQKLPPSYQMQWATQKMQLINQNKKPNLYEFDKWFFNIGITASSITVDHCTNKSNKEKTITHSNATTSKKAFIHSHSEHKCIVCDNNNNNYRTIANCPTYLSMDRGDKWNIVRKYKLCKFCLVKHSAECNKKKKCGKEGCEYFHHSSLHRYSVPVTQQQNEMSNKKPHSIEKQVVNNTHSNKINNILFKIIPIKIYGENKIIQTFAFIDEGSSISLMDESLANELKIDGVLNPLCLRWTGGMERSEESSKKLKICISGGNKKRVALDVSTVKSLNLPVQSLDYEMLSQRYRHLRKLPIESYSDAVPQILIGLNHFDLGVSSKIREGSPHEPVGVCTKLGWLIYGNVAENKSTSKHFNFHVCDCSATADELEELVRNFYSLDSVGITVNNPLVAASDKRALDLLEKFTKQKPSGHYEVPLLWKFDFIDMPDSYQMAFKRLICLERNLRHNKELFNIFIETISKYLSKGYIRKLNNNEIDRADRKIWYLPIFAVFNKNKPGKSRVVWDAAAKSNGMSLNSYLLKGPDYLTSLPSILFKFRQKSVAVCGDIEEMFHQVHIRPEDRDVQRFLWRDCLQHKTPDIYVMDVMIFGATCAPSISQYIKNLNASKFENEFPTAAKAIKDNHYVDDLLDSVDSSDEAIKLISDVSFVHRQAGFNIRNWISNNKLVLKSISQTNLIGVKCLNFKEEKQIEKVLGIFWENQEDVITFKISSWLAESDIFSGRKAPTKREMLRLVMPIYDPLGLIGHISMYVKVLMQDVWRLKIDWDEQIPPEVLTKWNFNPPASPHMGGAWERLLRSIKTILYKIMPSRSPSDELLLSMLLEVENVVNSRPLAYVPVNAESNEALTPNHFLVGSSSEMKPMSVCSDSTIILKQSWHISQQYANIFWKKWLPEYLPMLTCRSKWPDRPQPLCQGDLVFIVDPSFARNAWFRGKVSETRLASDGQVRSTKVLTQHGVLERPAAKLAILEVAHQRESDSEEASCHTAGGMLTPLRKSP